MTVWDAGGGKAFRTIVLSYVKGAHVLLFVYAVDEWCSFEDVQSDWVDRAHSVTQSAVRVLVASKVRY
jgi:GTPase SAR1 family protein